MNKRFCIFMLFIITILVISVFAWKKFFDTREWNVKQYGGMDSQRMFYTITDNRNRLVIIDGGYTENADEVKNVIKKHKNRVYAWIITHPHPDHVGAFNEIMKDNKNKIRVDRIYSVKYNYNRYKETAQDYDQFDSCATFDEIVKKKKNVFYLKEGDTFKLLGLKAEVFSAWNEKTDKFNDHLCNLGSLMFKISGKNKSMLFCADTQSEIEEGIIKKYGKELKADYVQCGHHGNWGLSTKFYDVVNPKIAFMDAPDSIVNNDNGQFDGYLLVKYFESKGIKVYRFNKNINSVSLD